MENSSYLYIGVAVVFFGVIYLWSKNKPIIDQEIIKKNNQYNNEMKIKLQEIEQTFTSQAIGFYLQEIAFEKNIIKVEKEKLFEDLGYKEEFSSPIINWSSEFSFMKSHIDERDEYIKEYLIVHAGKDFCNNDEFVLNCFERYLLEKSQKEATDKIVNIKYLDKN